MNNGNPDMTGFVKVKPDWDDVHALIENNLASDELNAKFICQKLGISRSGLFRLFYGRGGIDAYIRGQRIKQVRLALIKYGNRVKVKDLAKYWHFSDSSHLCRVFRQTYGLTISEAIRVN